MIEWRNTIKHILTYPVFKQKNNMKNIIYFIAGIIFVALISATTVSVMTVKPQLPTSTIAVYFGNDIIRPSIDVANFINKKSREGYILKTVVVDKYANAIVVMEKY